MNILQGDLFNFFTAGTDVIMHVCNCQRVMGSGIALEVKRQYPEAYFAYKTAFLGLGELPLGTISYAELPDGRLIINLHAQRFYGGDGRRYLDYEALYKCLGEAYEIVKEKNPKALVGIPYLMGCDRAGGDWKIVSAMISAVFHDVSIFAAKL